METALIIYSQGDNVPTLVDLYENETISLQFNFSDIKDLKPRGSYSRTFRIPASETNSKIFGFIQENTYQFASFNPKLKLNAIITVDTIPILEGNCQFKACYTSNGEVSEYEIVFFGNVVDFFKNIGDNDFKGYISTQLQTDLPYLLSYVNYDVINASNIAFFGLTDRGQNWVGMLNETISRSIYSNSISEVPKINELTLFVSAKYIFDKIIELSGFQLGDNSSTLITELDAMYIPWTSEANSTQSVGNVETARFQIEGGISGDTLTSADFTQITDANGLSAWYAPIPNMTLGFDYGPNLTNNVYTIPFSGEYNLQANLICQIDLADAANLGFKLGFKHTESISGDVNILYSPGTNALLTFFNINNGQMLLNQDFGVTVHANNGNVNTMSFFQVNDTLEPIIIYDSPILSILPWGGTMTLTTGYFKTIQINKPSYGNDIDWTANAPIMKCSEFMDSLFKMFNLVVVPNKINQKEIDFIPFTEYISQGAAKDWTPLLDISKDITLTATTDYQARKNTWTYKASSDLFNSIYNSQGNRVYGRLELIDPQNDFATDEQKIELYFGSTPIVPINAATYSIPKFVNNNYEYSAPTPRILYKNSETFDVNVYNDDGDAVVATTMNLVSHYSDFIPDINSRDLNFGQETPLCEVDSIPFKTLYARYWNEYIENIYAPDARVLEAFFSLEFADVYNFNFNDKIFIKDSYWRILSISDYVVGTQDTVKVTLIKQVTAEPDCLLTPSSITALGAVAFVDVNGDPAAATEVCCEVFNYNWIDGGCYAFSRDSDGTGKPKSFNQTTSSQSIIQKNALIQVDNSVVSLNNRDSIVIASNSFIGASNNNSIINGTNHYVSDNLGSVNVLGSTSYVLNGGVTIGSNGEYRGEMQNGLMPVWGKGDFTNDTTAITLLAYGTTYINMPNESVWLVKLRLMVGQVGALIDASVSGEYNLHIAQSGGTISLKNVTTIDETPIDIDGDFVIDLDVVGSTFAILVTLDNATSYPYDVINISGQLTYTQYHYE
jgi:hypothetical protein